MHRRSRRVKGGGRAGTWEQSGAPPRALTLRLSPPAHQGSGRPAYRLGRGRARYRNAASGRVTAPHMFKPRQMPAPTCQLSKQTWSVDNTSIPGTPGSLWSRGPQSWLGQPGKRAATLARDKQGIGGVLANSQVARDGDRCVAVLVHFRTGSCRMPPGAVLGQPGPRSGSCCSRGCRCK